MSTLYKRATPSQAMILRIVEGAIKNTCDAHKLEFNPRFARSVAKRAAGTLSDQIPAVLAAKPSEKIGAAHSQASGPVGGGAQLVKRRRAPSVQGPKVGGGATMHAPPPLRSLEKYLFSQMRDIKLSGNTEKANAFIEVLRKIAALKGACGE